MVILFTKRDLVSFGNYMAEHVRSGKKKPWHDGKIHVHHSDIENWKHEMDEEEFLTGTSQLDE